MSEKMPLGYETSKKDWIGFNGREYTLDEWNSMTFAQQQRYAVKEMESNGDTFHISNVSTSLTVNLNLSNTLSNLTEKEIDYFKFEIEKAVKKAAWACASLRSFGVT